MSGLFEKLYRYRQNENLRGQRENFLTEIFAHCLEVDIDFQKKFLKLIKYDNKYEKCMVSPQFFTHEFGKPDVYIALDNDTIILIECKVGAIQGKNQLKKYATFLESSSVSNKYLVFLTKDPEKVLDKEVLGVQQIRWYDIYNLLRGSTNEISRELLNYLKEHKMDINSVPFSKGDINAIAYIREAKQKMDGFLTKLENILTDYTSKKEKILPKQILFEWGSYFLETQFAGGKLLLGLYQWEEEMMVFIEIQLSSTSTHWKEVDEFLTEIEWEIDPDEEDYVWYKQRTLSSFIVDNVFKEEEALFFINEQLQKIQKIKDWGK